MDEHSYIKLFYGDTLFREYGDCYDLQINGDMVTFYILVAGERNPYTIRLASNTTMEVEHYNKAVGE